MSRIMIIDDDPSFRKIMRAFLEVEGHQVIDAESGEAGLRLFRAENPDLVVTDIFMPGLSGLETIERIRAEHPDVGIIAMSGRDGIAAATLLPEGSRADLTLQKPFRRTELIETVEQLLHLDPGESN
jgi:DNA-binding response OmpR family regulator